MRSGRPFVCEGERETAGKVQIQHQLKIGDYSRQTDGGLTNRKYVSITGTSSETAKRDIRDLMERNILLQNESGGGPASYRLSRMGIARKRKQP